MHLLAFLMEECLPQPPVKPPKPTKASAICSDSASAVDMHEVTAAIDEIPEDKAVESNFVPSDKATKDVNAIMAADAGDESLRKYKESLLGAAAHGDLGDRSDPRRLIVVEFRVCFSPDENLPDIVHNLSTPAGLTKLQSEGITLREGAKFKFRVSFKVQHEIVTGVKFINNVTKMVFSQTEELVIGSYPPSTAPHLFEFPRFDYNEAPKGILFRGTYRAKNTFIDSDKVVHLAFEYDLYIKK